MRDSFGRTIDYLRVSVTDRCNFRCIYCMPDEGYPVSPKPELLTFEEIARLIRVAASLGVTKVRLTGGEPLVRKDIPSLVAQIAAIPELTDISVTTNAFLLRGMASDLKRAGLHRANISLDTLDPETFFRVARRGDLSEVLAGIAEAQRVGLSPLKLNVVAMRGINDHEAPEFARWTMREPLHIRFIEIMPIRWNLDDTESLPPESAFANRGERGFSQVFTLRSGEGQQGMLNSVQMRRLYVPSEELIERIEAEVGSLVNADVITNGPARSYRLPGAPGTIGFISQISNDLCLRCNRLRLTADGFLRPCLMADGEVSLREPLRAGASDKQIAEIFEQVVRHKPERHYLADGQTVQARGMSQIGG